MSIIGSNILAGASGQAGGGGAYQISRSVRFSSSDSAFLSRTPGTAGNRKTWTWAGWVKRSELGTFQKIFGNEDSSELNGVAVQFRSDNALQVYDITSSVQWNKITAAVFRDASAWYHIVVAVDTTQATAANRIKLYVNGEQQTAFSTSSDPSLNLDTQANTATAHGIGRSGVYNASYFNGYLADIHFIDGQALDPSSFTEFDDNGVWQPKAFSGGSFGTNGFRLPFSDNSTAAALGTDTSGNGNTWTVNNISVTAGAGNDSLVDSPTNYGTDSGVGNEVRGNYATLNPLSSTAMTLSNGNLDCSTGTDNSGASGTVRVSAGKWFFEATTGSSAGSWVGWMDDSYAKDDNDWAFATGRSVYSTGGLNGNGGSYAATYTTNDVIGCALDLDNGTVAFYKNGVSQGTMWTGLTGTNYRPFCARRGYTFNFGQRPFAYTAPSGFEALCTTNLPEPTIADGSTVMDVALYTGNGSTQTISGLNFSPDLVWIKGRSLAAGHILNNFVAGTGTGKSLYSNTTSSEGTFDAYGYLSALTSDGFTTQGGTDPTDPYNLVGKSGQTYVAWCWDAGGTTDPSNEAGSITSQVRANASAGFSVVTYTGNGTANASVGHGLNIAPDFVIAKTRSKSDGWNCYHRSLGNAKPIALNSTNAAATNDTAVWGTNAGPTSSVFYVNYPGSPVYTNENNTTYVAYCFAPVAGYSAYGSYTGNGSADGPFVYTGFRPRWVMIKASSFSTEWLMLDTARSDFNFVNDRLQADSSAAEDTVADMDILSNGFKMRSALMNNNAATFIYAAFAENPFQYARAR
jgi:hypothetical protein